MTGSTVRFNNMEGVGTVASIHKNVKGLKRDGILLLLVDLAVIVLAMTSDTGIILPTEELYSLVLEFAIAILFDLWWVWDSKSWIRGKEVRKFLWWYVVLKCAAVALMLAFTFLSMSAAATAIMYILGLYGIVGIGLLLRYL